MARSSRRQRSVATGAPRRQWHRQSCPCSCDVDVTSADLRPRCNAGPSHAKQGDTPRKALFYVTPTKQTVRPHARCHTFSRPPAAHVLETPQNRSVRRACSARTKWDTVSLNFACISLKTKNSRTKEVGHFSKAEVSELKDALALQNGSSHSRMLGFQRERTLSCCALG